MDSSPMFAFFESEKNILIEIAVTHYVDAEKYSKIKNGADANSRNQHR